MTNHWYYQDHNRTLGPITTEELLAKIDKGELSMLDLIFKEGEAQWLPIESFKELTDLIGGVSVQKDAEWIILRVVAVDGKDQYEQIGPFNIDQVLSMVDQGRIRFNDFAWRQGFDSWVPLGKLDPFDQPLKSSVPVDMSLYQMPKTDILEEAPAVAVNKYNPKQKIQPVEIEEPAPNEAQGPDLSQPDWAAEVSNARREDVAAKPKQKTMPIEEPVAPAPEFIEDTVSKVSSAEEVAATPATDRFDQIRSRWSYAVSVIFVFLLVGGGITFIYTGSKKRPQIVPPPPIAKSQPSPRAASPAQPAEAPTPQTPPSVAMNPATTAAPGAAPTVAPGAIPEKTAPAGEGTEILAQPEKQMSYFHHHERMFLVYNAQKGLRFITDVQKLTKKTGKKWTFPKQKFAAWQAGVKTFHRSVYQEAQNAKVHTGLMKNLRAASSQLEARGRDLGAQAMSARGPSKEANFEDLTKEFKRIQTKARNLD